MPISGSDSHGDLYVEYKVVLPLELSSKMRRSKCLLQSMNLASLIANPVPHKNLTEPLTAITVRRRGKTGMSSRFLYFRPYVLGREDLIDQGHSSRAPTLNKTFPRSTRIKDRDGLTKHLVECARPPSKYVLSPPSPESVSHRLIDCS